MASKGAGGMVKGGAAPNGAIEDGGAPIRELEGADAEARGNVGGKLHIAERQHGGTMRATLWRTL